MKAWLKIEALLNSLIIAISNTFNAFVKKVTPSKVKTSIKKVQDQSHKTSMKISDSLASRALKIKEKVAGVLVKFLLVKNFIVEKVRAVATFMQEYDWKALNFTKVFAIVGAFLAPLLFKVKTYFANLKPVTVMTYTVTMVTFSLTGITVYQESQKISEKNKTQIREPQSISDTMDRNAYARSKYRHFAKRRVKLRTVSIPVYIENRKGMQSVIVDFTIESSNRYVAKYFDLIENEYVVRDRLSSKLQPVIPDFPMKDEGKNILRVKIKHELNELIKELKIKGDVEEVYIESILNG